MDERLRKAIDKSGMPRRVRESTVEGITPEIARLLPKSGGFGISGPVGSGKTGAVAATLIARMGLVLDEVAKAMESWFSMQEGTIIPPSPLAWCSWPETVNALRVMSTQDHGIEDAAGMVRRFQWARWLVLDDLGSERIKGDYADDWATTQLDLVLDERYNELRPVWYTTSLSREEFARRYGRRMVERLAAENPLIVVPRIESRRLA